MRSIRSQPHILFQKSGRRFHTPRSGRGGIGTPMPPLPDRSHKRRVTRRWLFPQSGKVQRSRSRQSSSLRLRAELLSQIHPGRSAGGRALPFADGPLSDIFRRIFLLATRPAKVALPNRQPPLRLGGRNWSSCPHCGHCQEPVAGSQWRRHRGRQGKARQSRHRRDLGVSPAALYRYIPAAGTANSPSVAEFS